MKSKGLSSVIGAVLLILISVGAAASAWSFVSQVSGQTQDNIKNRVQEQERTSKSELSTDLVFNGSDGYSIMTLRNSGQTTLKLRNRQGKELINMYVDGRPENWNFTESKDTYVALQPRQTVRLNSTVKFPAEGEEKIIEVRGSYETSTTYVCFNSGTQSC
ncbi:MAG: hypothetical protein ABEJ56_04820 [Candidatus Nanohaloarchaea archaeon]